MKTVLDRPWAIGSMPEQGDTIGYTKSGTPIKFVVGGARETFESWIPEETGSSVIVRFEQKSAVDALGRHEPMASDTKKVPRSGGFTVSGVAKGTAYGENGATNDSVELIARKIGGMDRIAEEDLKDIPADILKTKREEAAGAMAKFFDNATLGTTAAGNGGTVLYDSLYYKLATTDNAAPGGAYTANDNINLTGGNVTYAQINNALTEVESDDWADEDNIIWIAHPFWKGQLRGLVDGDQRPLWIPAASSGLGGKAPDTILGYPVYWTRGARKHATSTNNPTGAQLLIVGDAKGLIVGDRDGMESALQMPQQGSGFDTDEAKMKVRMRKGFNISHQRAFSIIEKS